MISPILFKSGINYSLRNPWQTLLSIIGISLGIAVVISIDIANQSAYSAFTLSMESVSGKATHQIIANPPGIPNSVFTELRLRFNKVNSAPVVEKFVKVKSKDTSIFTILGIDPIYEENFRNYTGKFNSGDGFDLSRFIVTKGGVLLSSKTAEKLDLKISDSIYIEVDGKSKSLVVIGMISPKNDNQAKIIENILITDISNAQDLTDIGNHISRIDLIIPDDDTLMMNNIKSILPSSVRIQKSEMRSESGKQMTESFRVNLTAMSLLALIVGMFLIYNTMTFSVVRRQKLLGLLRSIGVTKNEIFKLILFEAVVLGLVGTTLGIIVGIVLGNGIINLVTKTINDMYFVLQVQKITISAESIIKGIVLGISASVLSAYKPARDASSVTPRSIMTRSESEQSITTKTSKFVLYALILLLVGTAVLLYDSNSIYISYLGIAPVIIAFAFLSPIALLLGMKVLSPLMKAVFGSIGKMAARGISTQLSRTTISVAALSIAVSAAIGVGTMVSSFRITVVDWLNLRLKADIYASVPTMVSRFNDGTFSLALGDSISRLPNVKAINYYKENQINHNGSIKHILAAKVQNFNYESFRDNKVPNDTLWKKFNHEEGIFVSESYSFKNRIYVGDFVELPTNYGNKKFGVIGVFYDYSSDIGLIMMQLNTYQKYFNDSLLSGLAVFVDDKKNIDSVISNMKKAAGDVNFIVRSNRALIDSSVEIFDRTFLITNVLQLLSIIVSFIGILSALMALQLEKARELGVLRAIGLLPSQLWKMVILQTGIMGLISGVLALPLGNILAYILIHIINRRSFGWSIDYHFIPEYALQGLIVAILAAILAGIYPAYKMSKSSPSAALREE